MQKKYSGKSFVVFFGPSTRCNSVTQTFAEKESQDSASLHSVGVSQRFTEREIRKGLCEMENAQHQVSCEDTLLDIVDSFMSACSKVLNQLRNSPNLCVCK